MPAASVPSIKSYIHHSLARAGSILSETVAAAHVDLRRSRRSPRTATTRSESPNGASTIFKHSNPSLRQIFAQRGHLQRKPRLPSGGHIQLSRRSLAVVVLSVVRMARVECSALDAPLSGDVYE